MSRMFHMLVRRRFLKSTSVLFRRVNLVILLLMSLASVSCVHEFPEPGELTEVRLTLTHELPWSEYEYNYKRTGKSTRQNSAGSRNARYIIRAYRQGDVTMPLYEFVRMSDDLTLQPFTTSISLPEGEWDIYVWQEMTDSGKSFYLTSDFAQIGYADPYTGDTDCRDVFEGHTRVNVKASYEADHFIGADISLERPVAKYVFIATDFGKFYDEVLLPANQGAVQGEKKAWSSLSLSERKELLAGYSVTAYYPLFMPSVYDMFQQKAIDSARGIRYKAEIEPISDNEAVVSFDYVFMNHSESAVQVMLALRMPQGSETSMTPTVSVPLHRERITYVRGEFLTTGANGGLNIDFGFNDDYNIEL